MNLMQAVWLVYRRLRVGLGAFGILLLYGAYVGYISPVIFLVGLGFASIDIFGAMYNDYYDGKIDLLNRRQDKWISAGLVTRNQMMYLSFVFALAGLAMLYNAHILLFFLGTYYFLVSAGYSQQKIFMGRNLATYLLFGSPYLLMFYVLNILFNAPFSKFWIYYALFAFFQVVYVLAHKDVNDTKDGSNIFLKKYSRGFLVCFLSGILSSVFLLQVSLRNPVLLTMWFLNLVVLKLWLLKRIHEKTVRKSFRDRIVLLEFLTPYFYALALLSKWVIA